MIIIFGVVSSFMKDNLEAKGVVFVDRANRRFSDIMEDKAKIIWHIIVVSGLDIAQIIVLIKLEDLTGSSTIKMTNSITI